MTTRHVLLVPAEGDPHGLLREGPCGARPPTAWRATMKSHLPAIAVLHGEEAPSDGDTGWRSGRCPTPPGGAVGPYMTEYRDQQAALVLAWDGEPVPEGCDRAVRPLRGWAVAGVGGADRLMYTYTIEEAVEIARACEYTHLGTAVVVEAPDAGGEGT